MTVSTPRSGPLGAPRLLPAARIVPWEASPAGILPADNYPVVESERSSVLPPRTPTPPGAQHHSPPIVSHRRLIAPLREAQEFGSTMSSGPPSSLFTAAL